MANLSMFGPSFSQLSHTDAMAKIMAARKLRRMRLPEVVRKAPKEKPKTVTKAAKVKNKNAFDKLTPEKQKQMLQLMLAKRLEELK